MDEIIEFPSLIQVGTSTYVIMLNKSFNCSFIDFHGIFEGSLCANIEVLNIPKYTKGFKHATRGGMRDGQIRLCAARSQHKKQTKQLI